MIEGGVIERSVVSSNVRVHAQAEVRHSVIMEGVTIGQGSKIQNAIIDKQVVIPPNTKIGFDLELDKKRFVLTRSGIVIVAKRTAVD